MATSRPLIVGISGPSCSGKTAVALELQNILGDSLIGVIHCDLYWDLEAIAKQPKVCGERRNKESPEAINWKAIQRVLESMIASSTKTTSHQTNTSQTAF